MTTPPPLHRMERRFSTYQTVPHYLVHPCPTVVYIAPIHEARLQIHTGSHIKPRRSHVTIQVWPCPSLPERNARNVALQNLLNDF